MHLEGTVTFARRSVEEARALAPLGGVVLEAPRGDAQFWDDGGARRPSDRGDARFRAGRQKRSRRLLQDACSLVRAVNKNGVALAKFEARPGRAVGYRAQALGRKLAEHLAPKIRPGVLGRRTVSWEDFCEVLLSIKPDAAPAPAPAPAAAARRRRSTQPKPTQQKRKTEPKKAPAPAPEPEPDLDRTASRLQAMIRGRSARRVARTKTEEPKPDDRLVRVLARFQQPLRDVFRTYAARRGGAGSLRVVAPADFLRLCRELGASPALLQHADVAAVCRATLADAGPDAPGFDEANLSRALARIAVAAYAAVPNLGVGDKVEALFIHMGLAERLVERARAAKPKAAAHAAVAVSRKRPAEKKEPVAAAAPKPAPHPFDEPSRAPPPPSNAPPSSSYQWDSSYPAGGFRVGAAAGDPALFGNPYASFGRKQSTSKPPAFPPSPERANAVPANPVERARAQRRGSVPAMND
mmetsp:Transcript_32492/g.100558  ORF Transcript_32492/g.100558 Transcript_32492/m.100558 type:complete len:468 (-) Transcript_32492:58-1461(-)